MTDLMDLEEFAKRIDHTNLKPDSTERDIIRTIDEAKQYNFRGVCLPLMYVPLARKLLQGYNIKVVTVIGFPLGYLPTGIKLREALFALENGADELDVVMNISLFKSGMHDRVKEELKVILENTHLPLKVIIETSLLTPEEISIASKLVEEADAFCVKTNTGFGKRGVTLEDVKIIRSSISAGTKIKAAGGIRTAEKALELIRVGADIIGASAGVKLYEEYKKFLRERTM